VCVYILLCIFCFECITGEAFAEVSIFSCLKVFECKECIESARCALTEARQPQENSRGIALDLHQHKCKVCTRTNFVSSLEGDRTTEGSVEALPGGH
jgi:hypothetical protein